MQKVSRFVTEDGTEFDNKNDAKRHENDLRLHNALTDVLGAYAIANPNVITRLVNAIRTDADGVKNILVNYCRSQKLKKD